MNIRVTTPRVWTVAVIVRFMLYALLSIGIIQQIHAAVVDKAEAETKAENSSSSSSISDDNPPCRLYMGPSSLSTEKHTNYALFAGVAFHWTDTLPFSELAVPFIDFLNGPYSQLDRYSDILTALEPNLWSTDTFLGPAKFESNHSQSLFVPGIGSLANYHKTYANVKWLHASVAVGEKKHSTSTTTPGQAHPTRGTNTNYHNYTLRAMRDIPAGMELFVSHADKVDDAKDEADDEFEQHIVRSDYKKANDLVDKLVELLLEHPDVAHNSDLQEETLDLILGSILSTAAGKRATAIRSLIPATTRKLKDIQKSGSFLYRNGYDMIKSPAWLRKNAICVDVIEPKRSTIANAGMGAFARRAFQSGDYVTVTPVLPLYDDVLQMWSTVEKKDEDSGNKWLEFGDTFRGTQLILNYAFGHPQTTLLFLPLAPGVSYINHGDSDKVNVEISWSYHDLLYTDADLFGKSVETLRAMNPQPHFLMEVLAKRNISEGEELFFDYGLDWESTWNYYLASHDWTAVGPPTSSDLMSYYQSHPFPTNQSTGSTTLQTNDASSPPLLPDSVLTACFAKFDEAEDGTPKRTAKGNIIYKWGGPHNDEDYNGSDLYRCDLLSRSVTKSDDSDDDEQRFNASRAVYTANVFYSGSDGETTHYAQVTGIPHVAIIMVEKPYQSDLHDKDVFRHFIQLNDRDVPPAWRKNAPLAKEEEMEEEDEEDE